MQFLPSVARRGRNRDKAHNCGLHYNVACGSAMGGA